jgi:hypothetical protein
MHATRLTRSDLGSINVPTEQAKLIHATRDPLGAPPGSRYPGRQSCATGVMASGHAQRAEAGR